MALVILVASNKQIFKKKTVAPLYLLLKVEMNGRKGFT